MNFGEIRYRLRVIRKGYKNISAPLGLTNFVFIVLAGVFAFLLLAYEPADEWHNTTFVLSHDEYRYTRGGGVLDLYTTDGRRFVLNHNDEAIRHELVYGQQYAVVYSDDLFHDIIKGLEDSECEYVNVNEMRNEYVKERTLLVVLLVISLLLLIMMNAIYAVNCIREEKKRIKRYKKKKS